MLKIAISNESISIKLIEKTLQQAGLDVMISPETEDILLSRRFPSEVRFMSNSQIMQALKFGQQDVAIIDSYILDELGIPYKPIYSFEETRMPMSIFVPSTVKYRSLRMFMTSKIASFAPNLLRAYLKEKRIRNVTIIDDPTPQKAVKMGIADFFADFTPIVKSPQHIPTETFLQSRLVMLISPEILPEKRDVFVDELIFRLDSVVKASSKVKVEIMCDEKYINKIVALISGLDENMLILSSFNKQKIIIQMLVDERQIWDIQHYLKELKVDRILVQEVAKIIV